MPLTKGNCCNTIFSNLMTGCVINVAYCEGRSCVRNEMASFTNIFHLLPPKILTIVLNFIQLSCHISFFNFIYNFPTHQIDISENLAG